MRKWSIIFGLIIFVCVVTVSFSHTVDLYERVGFKQWEAVMITIAVETTFLLSGWSILWYRFRGQSPGGPAYAGFVYGVAIVLFSNSAYTVRLNVLFENNIAQWVLALSVVFGVLIAEAIISRNLIRLREHERENKQTAEQTDEQTAEQTNKTNSNDQTNGSNKQDKREQTTPDKQTNRQTNEQSGKQTDKQTASTTYSEHENKQTNKRRSKQTQTDNAKVYDEAVRYYKEKGTLPSVRTLAMLADCSNHRAYKVLQELREKAG